MTVVGSNDKRIFYFCFISSTLKPPMHNWMVFTSKSQMNTLKTGRFVQLMHETMALHSAVVVSGSV